MAASVPGMTRGLRGRHQRNHPSHNNPSFPSLPILQILVQKRPRVSTGAFPTSLPLRGGD